MCLWPRPGQDSGVAVVTVKDITLVGADESVASTTATAYEGLCVAVSADGTLLATGGGDSKLRVYTVSGTTLTQVRTSDSKLDF